MPKNEGLGGGEAEAVGWPIHAKWVIPHLLRLDASNVGFLANYLKAGRTRQQVIEAVLSIVPLDEPGSFLERLGVPCDHECCQLSAVAQALRSGRSKALLKAAYRERPDGFLPAIVRSTFRRPDSYLRLHQMLAQRHERAKARALAYCDLSDELLVYADLLPEQLLRPRFIRTVQSVEEARRIQASYAALKEFNPAALEEPVLREVENVTAFRKLVERSLVGIEFPAPPVPGVPGVMEPATNGGDLKRLARRFRNCLENSGFALDILSRRRFIYEFVSAPGAIVSLRRLQGPADTWLVVAIDGFENRGVREETREVIRGWFEQRGVATMGRPDRPASLEAVAELLRGRLMGLDDFAFG